MGFFRREPLHRRLARDAGMLGPDVETLRPSWDKVGIHGVSRPRAWDAVVTAGAPGIDGDEVDFVALADGTLVLETDVGDADVAPLADALETRLERPYRAHAARQREDLWAVAGREIMIARFDADGDEVQLAVHGGEKTLTVDGEQVFGSVPALEALGEAQGVSYAARASRVDDGLWEVEISPL